jgi:hypothetical protein
MLLRLAALSPENIWAFEPFKLFCVRIRAMWLYVMNIFCLRHLNICKFEMLVIYFNGLCCSVSTTFLGEF